MLFRSQHPPKTPPAGHMCRNAGRCLSYAPHPLLYSRPIPVTAPLAIFIRRPRQFSAPALVFAAFISPRDPSAAKLLAKFTRGFRDERPLHSLSSQQRKHAPAWALIKSRYVSNFLTNSPPGKPVLKAPFPKDYNVSGHVISIVSSDFKCLLPIKYRSKKLLMDLYIMQFWHNRSLSCSSGRSRNTPATAPQG